MKNLLWYLYDVIKTFIAGIVGIFIVPICIALIYYLYMIVVGESKTFIVVDQSTFTVQNVKEKDKRFTDMWDSADAFILNSSGKTLELEEVIYTVSVGFGDSNKSYKIKNSKEIQILQHEPDYIFKTPPKSIRVKNGMRTVRWHLKR